MIFMDPDGKDVYILINTGGRPIDYAAVATRKAEIESRISAEGREKQDSVRVVEAFDLGKLHSKVDDVIRESKIKFGKTVELSEWGHGGHDGPIGRDVTSGRDRLADDDGSKKQMQLAEWAKIDFNFDPKHSIAAFYGCNELDFAKKFIAQQPNLQFTAGFDVSSYPSRKAEEHIWHISKSQDARVDSELEAARGANAPWVVYFVGQSSSDRESVWGAGAGRETTLLKVIDRSGGQQKAVPNVDSDLLNRGPWKVTTRENDRP
jgi:hypothetical protein